MLWLYKMGAIFEIVEKYGWQGVLIAMALGAVFLFVKFLGNKLEENKADTVKGMQDIATSITSTISTQNSELINKITSQQEKLLDYIIKDKTTTQEEHKDMLFERMELADEINQKLKEIMHIHQAQRVFIIEFHNSYQNFAGIPFAKYSCTYEWFDKGLQSLQNKCINLPFSSMSNIIKQVLMKHNHIVIYRDIQAMEEDNPALSDILKNIRTKGVIYSGMFDNKNQLIGCLVIEYIQELPETIQENNILLETAELTQVINLRYKYQKN